MIKTIVEVIIGIVGLFGVSFIVVLIQDALKDNPKYKEEHRKKLYDWLIGARKDFPHFIILLSFLLLSPTVCSAQKLEGDIMTPDQVAEAKAKGYKFCDGTNETPDEIAESRFAHDNMIINAQGNRELKIPVTGQRQIISNRLAVNENGQLEGIPDDNEFIQQRKTLQAIKERNKQAFEEAGLRLNGDPQRDKQERENKEGRALGEIAEKRGQDVIDQWEKDKKGETPRYVPQKALVSYETIKK